MASKISCSIVSCADHSEGQSSTRSASPIRSTSRLCSIKAASSLAEISSIAAPCCRCRGCSAPAALRSCGQLTTLLSPTATGVTRFASDAALRGRRDWGAEALGPAIFPLVDLLQFQIVFTTLLPLQRRCKRPMPNLSFGRGRSHCSLHGTADP